MHVWGSVLGHSDLLGPAHRRKGGPPSLDALCSWCLKGQPPPLGHRYSIGRAATARPTECRSPSESRKYLAA